MTTTTTATTTKLIDAGNAWIPMMDDACRAILALGYTPQDCHIVHHELVTGWLNARRVLMLNVQVKDGRIVGGQEVFEVVTTVEQEEYVFTVTNAPRVIQWPEMRL